ncbi:copper chaperone PCu(A)C [Aureimonas frigidaquae]|uniref:copper chaperone PCu(A)C n=1 Tax=Aureimonas frigidaquae TaxID=424757 RepID=UPI0007850EEC|nr:copper chaperone PCu(A)C [Aureimonas frigidaquae]
MKITHIAAFAALVLTLAPGAAPAHEYTQGSLHVGHPWSRATPPNSNIGAGYMTLRNDSSEPDRLIEAHSPAADRVELHSVEMVDGVMKMRPVEDGLPLPPGEDVALEPGDMHFMLIGLKAPLKEGAKVPLELTFAQAGTVTVELAVGPMGSPSAGQGHGAH